MSVAERASSDLAEHIPLSFNQEFLCGFDRGDDEGPFGPRFHIVHGWRLHGPVDVNTLRDALDDVVARHEALRTLIVRDEGERHQRIFPPSSPELEVRDHPGLDPRERDRRVEELLIEVEAGTISARRLPLVRAVLARFDDHDWVLVLIAHHIATDGWSIRVIIRDLAACYAIRRGFAAELPESRQYQEYAVWQRAQVAEAATEASREYWREKLRGARIYAASTDQHKSAGPAESTSVFRFSIGEELVSPALGMARTMRCTPFMVLLAAFVVFVRRTTGTTDIVVPTFTPGRSQERFHNTVGPFLNFVPLRTDIAGCGTFRDVVRRVRATCVETYLHDIPFALVAAEAPELMLPTLEDDAAACVFQVFPFPFVLDGDMVGDVEYSEVRRRLLSQPVGSDVPNGALWTLNIDPDGDVIAGIQFNNNLYHQSTISGMVSEFVRVLRDAVAAPDAALPVS
ncbi:MAG TPA: condensation domain-containing protein [Mycobacteriales bacterium]